MSPRAQISTRLTTRMIDLRKPRLMAVQDQLLSGPQLHGDDSAVTLKVNSKLSLRSEIESLDPKQYAQIEPPKSSHAPIHLHPKRQRRKWNLWKKRRQAIEIDIYAMDMPPQPKKPSAFKKGCAKIGAKMTAAYRRVLLYLKTNPFSLPKTTKLSIFDQLDLANQQSGACFGVPLSDIMGPDGENGLPLLAKDALRFILSHKSNKNLKRLFSNTADWKKVQKIINVYNSGTPSESERKIVTKGQIEAVGSALLYFLHQLPMPICHNYTFFNASDRIMFAHAFPEWTFDVQVEWLQEMINGLADPEFYLFRALIALSSQVLPDYYDDILSAYLASVWSQVFIQAPEHQPESQMNELKLFIQTCIDYYWPIFGTD